MKNIIIISFLFLSSLLVPAAENDFIYLQKNASGSTVERVLNLTANKTITVDSFGRLQCSTVSATGTIANINLSGNSSQVLNGNGTWTAMPNFTGNATITGNITYTGNITVTGPLAISANTTIGGAHLGTVASANFTGNATKYLNGNGTWTVPSSFSGNYSDLSGKPTLFSGNYSDLVGKPNLFSGNYSDLSGKPTLGTVAAINLSNNGTKYLNGNGTWTTPAGGGGSGDVTLAGNNAFTGNNTFSKKTTVYGELEIQGPTFFSIDASVPVRIGYSLTAPLEWMSTLALVSIEADGGHGLMVQSSDTGDGIPIIGFSRSGASAIKAIQDTTYTSATQVVYRKVATGTTNAALLVATDAGTSEKAIQISNGSNTDVFAVDWEGNITVNGNPFIGGGGSIDFESTPPATPTSTGTQGTQIQNGNYLYICVDTNTWRRIELNTW